MNFIIPDDVKYILNVLYKNKYEAFAVGGCVRDTLLGKIPNDWDICTNAKPLEIKSCFKNFTIFDAGIKHGTISVLYNNSIYEITTYRIDGEYEDNRHPENVTFTNDIVTDLARRDFTVNAMAYNEKSGIVDPFNGRADLAKGVICCVRDADERLKEDALRILRALRFASTYGFDIDDKTAKSINKNKNLLKNIALERINTEFTKLICGFGAEEILNKFKDVISGFIPELSAEFDFNQNNKHHNRDLWSHTTHSLISIEADPVLRMTMLLHDIGKPSCCTIDRNGESHFIGHPDVSADMSRIILRRMKYSNDFIDECVCLIRNHDFRYSGSKKQLKHLLAKTGERKFEKLIKIFRADIAAQSDYQKKEKLALIDLAEKDFRDIIEKEHCFSLKQLAVNGNDMIAIGIKDGKKIGETLKNLLNMVIEDNIENDRYKLLEAAKAINIKKNQALSEQ